MVSSTLIVVCEIVGLMEEERGLRVAPSSRKPQDTVEATVRRCLAGRGITLSNEIAKKFSELDHRLDIWYVNLGYYNDH